MRKLVLAAVAAVVVAGMTAPMAQAKPHRAHKASSRFTVHVNIPQANVLGNPAFAATPPAPNVLQLVGGSGTFTGKGNGQVYFTLAGVTQEVALVHAVLQFSNGTLNMQGLTTATPGDPERYALTGGTGKYRGARGEAIQSHDVVTDQAEAFDLTFRFVR